MKDKRPEYAVESKMGGVLVRADTEEEALETAWAYTDLREGVEFDKSRLKVRRIDQN